MAIEPRVEHRQHTYQVRLEWGLEGVELLAAERAVVVVDALSFCTSVDIAVGLGTAVLPLRYDDPAAAAMEAAARAAVLAGDRAGTGPSLRPSSLVSLLAGTRLALPSPNGATLCAAVARTGATLFAGCLCNASAVATAALEEARDWLIGPVPAGERWPGGTLRVAAEDALGAGAIAAAMPAGGRSPEAELAVVQFSAARDRGLSGVLAVVSSGVELIAEGFGADVELAAALDTSVAVPRLHDGLLTARTPQ